MGKDNQWKEKNYQIKNVLEHLEKRKITSIWEYWKLTPSEEQGSSLKPNSATEI